jgi:hypothetical protein
MLNAASRDIRTIRAQENIGAGASLLVEHCSLKILTYMAGIVAVGLSRRRSELLCVRDAFVRRCQVRPRPPKCSVLEV